MSVLSCVRPYCGSIMCDTYVLGIGYICKSCQSEFKEYLKSRNLAPQRHETIMAELGDFIETDKHSFGEDDLSAVDDFFDNCTD